MNVEEGQCNVKVAGKNRDPLEIMIPPLVLNVNVCSLLTAAFHRDYAVAHPICT
jgi:hypothetical protein